MSYYRYPKTAQCMRQYAASQCYDYPIRIRGKRRPQHLPHAWDDYIVHTERNWKKYRKTQCNGSFNTIIQTYNPDDVTDCEGFGQ